MLNELHATRGRFGSAEPVNLNEGIVAIWHVQHT